MGSEGRLVDREENSSVVSSLQDTMGPCLPCLRSQIHCKKSPFQSSAMALFNLYILCLFSEETCLETYLRQGCLLAEICGGGSLSFSFRFHCL